jgi:hypothetical protein
LFVIALYCYSQWKATHLNGFIRKLPSHQITGIRAFKLPPGRWYIAGIDSTEIYLGSRSARNQLLKINLRSKDSSRQVIKAPDTMKFTNTAFLRIDISTLFLFDPLKAAVLTGKVEVGQLANLQRTPFFNTVLPLSRHSIIYSVIGKSKENTLIEILDGKVVARYVPEKQGERIFSSDGMLTATGNNSRIFYSYYYRNQFVCLDTNLKVLYKNKTIDTVSHAQISVAKINSLNQLTLSKPPVFVNVHSGANNNYLFIHSALKADNEVSGAMKKLNDIDVYAVKDGRYLFSLYVPNFLGEKLRDFRVSGQNLVVIYDHYLYFNQLNFEN